MTGRFHHEPSRASFSLAVVAIATLPLAIGACSKKKPGQEGKKAPMAATAHGDHEAHGHEQGAHGSGHRPGAHHGGEVAVPEGGKEFKPPVKPEQLPAGVWYCDMGTVHYARPITRR